MRPRPKTSSTICEQAPLGTQRTRHVIAASYAFQGFKFRKSCPTRRFKISWPASAEMPASFSYCLNHSSDATGRGNTAAKRLGSVSDGKQRPKAKTGTSRNASTRTVCLNADSLTRRGCLRLPTFASRFVGCNRAHNSWWPQENVQRQIAVMFVVAIGRSALPASHAGVCPWLGLQKARDQHFVDGRGRIGNLVVALGCGEPAGVNSSRFKETSRFPAGQLPSS